MKRIPLTQGKFALVDDEDFNRVSAVCWHAYYQGRTWYAKRSVGRYPKCPQTIYLHRFILGFPPARKPEVDHVNGDGLDNRKSNLRLCTHSQNMRNQNLAVNNRSGTTGVSYNRALKKWLVRIVINGRRKSLGYYHCLDEAVVVRKAAEGRHYGEWVRQ